MNDMVDKNLKEALNLLHSFVVFEDMFPTKLPPSTDRTYIDITDHKNMISKTKLLLRQHGYKV